MDDSKQADVPGAPPVDEPPLATADTQPMSDAAEDRRQPACGHDHAAPSAHDLSAAPPGGGTWSVVHLAAPPQDEARAGAPAADAGIWAEARVSGRYRARGGTMDLELRIDVDGPRPLRRVSGDLFRRQGDALSYFGSFVVDAPRLTVTLEQVVIEGMGRFEFAVRSNFDSRFPVLRVTIPAPATPAEHPAVTAQFLSTSGAPGPSLTCGFESKHFRSVEFELDIVEQLTPFEEYDTGRLPSGGPARVLTVPAAYAEAGIELIHVGAGGRVPIQLAGEDQAWDDAELHAAMLAQFGRWSPATGWRAWLLAATAYKSADPIRGIMFDHDLRQGCAVFHGVIGGATDKALRGMLRTYVHELGHCFNLVHPDLKVSTDPRLPNPGHALSWMQYPHTYPGASKQDESPFWNIFPFQFVEDELVHLRHGFRDAVVPGAQPFGMGAADLGADVLADPATDASGLRLELRAPERFLLGTPVVVEIKLSTRGPGERMANRLLHPNMGFMRIGITRPDGRTTAYRPLMTRCADPQTVTLTADAPAIYDSAYIGYGKDGHYFDAPGRYALRAVCKAPDGSTVVSSILHLEVLAPLDRKENELAELFLGEDQGSLLYLLGSDSEHLASGRRSFQRVLERHPDHPMADYARLVEGCNAARPFKRIEVGAEGARVAVRAPDSATGSGFLRDLFDRTRQRAQPAAQADDVPASRVPQLDNISLNMAAQRLGETLIAQGDRRSAAKAMQDLLGFLSATVKVPPHVQAQVEQQVRRLLGGEADEDGAAPAART